MRQVSGRFLVGSVASKHGRSITLLMEESSVLLKELLHSGWQHHMLSDDLHSWGQQHWPCSCIHILQTHTQTGCTTCDDVTMACLAVTPVRGGCQLQRHAPASCCVLEPAPGACYRTTQESLQQAKAVWFQGCKCRGMLEGSHTTATMNIPDESIEHSRKAKPHTGTVTVLSTACGVGWGAGVGWWEAFAVQGMSKAACARLSGEYIWEKFDVTTVGKTVMSVKWQTEELHMYSTSIHPPAFGIYYLSRRLWREAPCMRHCRNVGGRGGSAATTSSTTLLYIRPRDIRAGVCRGLSGGLSLDRLACRG